MHERVVQQMQLDAELRHAVDRNEFVLHYQPIMHLGTERILGVEALVRWQHPTRGLLGPGEFLDRVEDNGLIVPIGRWVLQEACRQLRRWDRGHEHIAMSINISARQLQDETLPTDVREAAHAAGIDPRRLTLEITETALMQDTEATIDLLDQCKLLGVQLALDDFGTGYSSLAYLKRLPVDEVKLDKSFVLNMTGDADDAAIVRSTIELAHNLGLQLVAEGVEDQETLELLASIGCDLVQGYHLARPMPANELANLQRHPGPFTVGRTA
jgi:EAL domain-containing protein (putative c-di-GMP-specific phosphodiesterase class I)